MPKPSPILFPKRREDDSLTRVKKISHETLFWFVSKEESPKKSPKEDSSRLNDSPAKNVEGEEKFQGISYRSKSVKNSFELEDKSIGHAPRSELISRSDNSIQIAGEDNIIKRFHRKSHEKKKMPINPTRESDSDSDVEMAGTTRTTPCNSESEDVVESPKKKKKKRKVNVEKVLGKYARKDLRQSKQEKVLR